MSGKHKMQQGTKAHYGGFKQRPPIMEPTISFLSSYPSPSVSPSPSPSPSSFTPPAIENPIGDLKELCDFVRTPYDKQFEEDGHAHSKRYKCNMMFCGKQFESDWMSNQKEAEKNAALKLLSVLPVRKVDDSHVNQRGSSHEMHFQAVLNVSDGVGGTIEFSSDWMKKKLEARRDIMQKIVKHYFGDSLESSMQSMNLGTGPAHATPASAPSAYSAPASATTPRTPYSAPAFIYTTPPAHAHAPQASPVRPLNYNAAPYNARAYAMGGEGAYGGGREHYVYSSDDTSSKVAEYLHKWQNRNLAIIKQRIGIDYNEVDPDKRKELDGYLTVAFIHPSFTHSEELKTSVKQYLGVKWPSYERLEFYGDAILGFVASRMLFEESDTDGPHELTIKRQKIVREDACCSCMKKMMLDKFVIHRDILQTPSAKVLCDIYEAIIGALYCVLRDDAYPIITGLIDKNRE